MTVQRSSRVSARHVADALWLTQVPTIAELVEPTQEERQRRLARLAADADRLHHQLSDLLADEEDRSEGSAGAHRYAPQKQHLRLVRTAHRQATLLAASLAAADARQPSPHTDGAPLRGGTGQAALHWAPPFPDAS